MKFRTCAVVAFAFVCTTGASFGQQAAPAKGFYSFGADQTIADIGKLEWAPLKLEGLPEGIEIATLRGDLGKGGGEIAAFFDVDTQDVQVVIAYPQKVDQLAVL